MASNISEDTTATRSDSIQFQEALLTLRKYKLEILLLAALATSLVYLALSAVTPIYRSTATLLINSSEKTKVVSVEDLISSEATSENFQTQIEILRSKRLAQRVVEEMNLTSHWEFNPALDKPPEFHTESAVRQFLAHLLERFEQFGSANASNVVSAPSDDTLNNDRALNFAVNRLRSNIAIVPVKNTTLVRIRVDAEDPELAFSISNQYGKSYIEDILETKQNVTGKASVWLDKRLIGLKEKLVQSEAKLVEFREKNGLVDLGGRVGGLKEQQIAVLTARSVDAEREKRELEILLAEIDNVVEFVSRDGAEFAIGRSRILREYESLSVISSNGAVQRLRRDILNEESVLQELGTRYGEKHPLVIAAKTKLGVAIRSLDDQIERLIDSVRKQYEFARSNARALEAQLNREEQATYVLDRKQIEMNQLEREVEANRSLYQTFSARARDANHGEGIGAAVIASISDPALTIPSNPVFPRTKLALQLSFILSLLGLSFLAVMFEKYRDTIQGVDSVVKKLGLPMLGLVPLVRQEGGNRKFRTPIIPGRYDDKNGLFEESFKTIRTSLYLSSKDDKFIMVSSTLPSEGKSTVALNLSHSMSLVERVLLIEADMRRPTLSLVRNLPLRERGLSNHLRDDTELDKCISHIPGTNLDILPAGFVPDMPLELLSSAKFEAMLSKLRVAYDKIIIDTAPVAAVSDAFMIGRLVDSAIFVTRADSTQIEDVQMSLDRLQAAGIKITGVVVSKVDVKKIQSYGGKKGYRGYVESYDYTNGQAAR